MLEVARIHKVETGSSLKAFVDVVVEEAFVIKGVRVIKGKKGLFVGMPITQGKDGKWYSVVEISNDDLKKKFQDIVLAAYNA